MLIQVTNEHFVIINFDNRENLEPFLSNEIKMALVYIAGYITRNDNQSKEYEIHFYYEKYRKFTNLID